MTTGLCLYRDRTFVFYTIFEQVPDVPQLMVKGQAVLTDEVTQIVTGHFGGETKFSDLLCYHRGGGQATFYKTDRVEHSTLSLIGTPAAAGSEWPHVLAENFGTRSGYSDLLFYHLRDNGRAWGTFYKTDGQASLQQTGQGNWRGNWTHMLTGQFGGGTGNADIFFYDSMNGVIESNKVQNGRPTTLYPANEQWQKGWTHVLAGNFESGSSNTNVLFYASGTGNWEIYATHGQQSPTLVKSGTIDAGASHLIAGNFVESSQTTDILCYHQQEKKARFYKVLGQGAQLSLMRLTDTPWDTTWDLLTPWEYAS
ncbi:MAG TPA: hypothetical protein VFN35_30130 [Ktedonobacteraceae bacterium]|nr:hypothetical protein [Ktedonobacteraceae bacterium]